MSGNKSNTICFGAANDTNRYQALVSKKGLPAQVRAQLFEAWVFFFFFFFAHMSIGIGIGIGIGRGTGQWWQHICLRKIDIKAPAVIVRIFA